MDESLPVGFQQFHEKRRKRNMSDVSLDLDIMKRARKIKAI
jgi:hypothetical protein